MISYTPLLKLMDERHLNFAELESISGVSDGALRRAARDGSYIKTSTLEVLCNKLHCNIDEVICWVDEEQKGSQLRQKCHVNWLLLDILLQKKDTNLSKLGVEILERSVNYLTKKRHYDNPLDILELTKIAEYCGVTPEELSED